MPGLRVGFDATPLLGTPTGVGVFAGQVLQALANRSDLDLVAYGLTWRGRQHLSSLVPDRVSVSSRPMAARPLRMAWAHCDLPPIEWWSKSIDVVHGTNFVVPPTNNAAALVTVHDLTCIRFPELCTPDTLEYPNLLRRAFKRGAHVHAVSQFVADEVIELLGAEPKRVHVVHHGHLDVSGGDPERGKKLVGASRYVLALGTVEPRKDLITLIRAFNEVAAEDPDLHLGIAGPDGWGADELNAMAVSSIYRDRIRRLGWVSNVDRAALLAGAAIFAYPSLYEGFGFPPLEAMSVGVPVVTTDAGALPEVLGDGALFSSIRHVEDLARNISRLLSDDELRQKMISRGKEQSLLYQWDKCGEGLASVYQKISD